MNDEREIKFIYSEKFDEKVFNRILELMKELIISRSAVPIWEQGAIRSLPSLRRMC